MTTATQIPQLTLNNGVEIPQLGFGVFQVPPGEVVAPVTTALEAGYRLVDTAAAYQNEEGVGRALRESGVPRAEVFVTTKLWNADHGRDAALAAFDASMAKLGLDTVDLYLIHWPQPGLDRYVETWQALEELYRDGRARAIGVSNFTERHLNRLLAETEVIPAVNQVELHPRFPQEPLRAFHAEHQIATEAWSPLGQGGGLLEDPVIASVARSRARTPAQVVLRWHLQLGCIAIPKSVTPERILANLEVGDFELDDQDMAALTALGEGEGAGGGSGRIGPDPEQFEVR